jgi:hypothetical protein
MYTLRLPPEARRFRGIAENIRSFPLKNHNIQMA